MRVEAEKAYVVFSDKNTIKKKGLLSLVGCLKFFYYFKHLQ